MDWNPVKRKYIETFSKYSERRKTDSESDDFLSNHSDSPSHKSEESVHSTDNYHYVKKIIKYSANHPGINPSKSSKKPKKVPLNGSKLSSKSKINKSKPVFSSYKQLKKPKREKLPKSDPEKNEIISKILQRWWYALEDWPPANFNYSAALKKLKLTLIPSDQAFSTKKSSKEVKIFPGYPGVYFNPSGIQDLRPQDSCPSYDNLYKKPLKELKEILNKAFKNQILQLKSQNPVDVELVFDLQNELNSIKTNI